MMIDLSETFQFPFKMGVNLAETSSQLYASFFLSSCPVTVNYSWLSVDELIISPCMSSLMKAAGSKGSQSPSLIFLSSFVEGRVNSSIIPVLVIATAVSVNLTGAHTVPDGVARAC